MPQQPFLLPTSKHNIICELAGSLTVINPFAEIPCSIIKGLACRLLDGFTKAINFQSEESVVTGRRSQTCKIKPDGRNFQVSRILPNF